MNTPAQKGVVEQRGCPPPGPCSTAPLLRGSLPELEAALEALEWCGLDTSVLRSKQTRDDLLTWLEHLWWASIGVSDFAWAIDRFDLFRMTALARRRILEAESVLRGWNGVG